MYKYLITFVLLTFLSPLMAQSYVTLGVNFGTMFYKSKDLDRFKETYNLINGEALLQPMKGFGTGEGIRWAVGFRHFGRMSMAVQVGLQNYKGKDGAKFQNKETRNIELKMKSILVEFEAGKKINTFFINGLVTVYFNRKLTMQSSLQGDLSGARNPLNGTYKSKVPLASDIGIALGVLREPITIIGKISYPIYTGGTSNILDDPSSEKIADGFNFFPDNFVKFVDGETYKGVASNIDGLKISITMAIVIPLKF